MLSPQPHLGTTLGCRGQAGEGEEVPNCTAQTAGRAALQAVPGHCSAHPAQTPLRSCQEELSVPSSVHTGVKTQGT